jgi:hypothetical protein
VSGNLALALKFLVEAEHGSFLLTVKISSTTSAGGEVSVCWSRADLCLGCWAAGVGA